MNEKKNIDIKKIAMYLALTVLISYSICAVLVFSTEDFFSNNSKNNLTINDTKKIGISGVKNINVDSTSENVTITPTNGAEITAHFYGDIKSAGKYKKPVLKLTHSGDSVNISIEHQTNIMLFFFSSNVKLDIKVPAAYADRLNLSSSSGNIKLNDLKLSKLSIDLTSGNVNGSKLIADDFSVDSSSGDLEFDNLKTKTANFEASSGNIDVTNFSGNITSNTTSGDASFAYDTFNNASTNAVDVDIDVSSGNIELLLPKTAKFNLDASTNSGNINCNFPITLTDSDKSSHSRIVGNVGTSSNNINLHATSGNIKMGTVKQPK